MGRLTADLVRGAAQGLNCLGDWELDLRAQRLVTLDHLDAVAPRLDALDVSRNFLPHLPALPPAPRLRHLHVGRNRVASIGVGFADAVPALESLLLTDNAVATLAAARLVEELARLPRLTLLSLRGNPVARSPNYRAAVLAALPAVRVLDFVRTVEEVDRLEAALKSGDVAGVLGGGGGAPAAAAAGDAAEGGSDGAADAVGGAPPPPPPQGAEAPPRPPPAGRPSGKRRRGGGDGGGGGGAAAAGDGASADGMDEGDDGPAAARE
ncbi:hypothetical protein BU14_0060s0023 [Porphyra umbilicalis]|uniref:U2A'/phosphoprotein 32 family A C-terminal domain-containing protein n=1 Tax=Porphyra umbilicalis TaxID=2786 RepID=A0A1X6PGR7_PORUM|nr:hypothetical protein BU14_0060s0023 [Porphyra umbilicalis]|eukprot:OSX80057.1 hypothetical protein BU14_0060s0023 [Porphyra umbilicalis]